MQQQDRILAGVHDLINKKLDIRDDLLRDALVGHMLGELFEYKEKLPLVTVIDRLVEVGNLPADLLAALVHCERLHLDEVLADLRSSSVDQQMTELDAILGHYSRVQKRWMGLIVSRYEERLQDLSRKLDEEACAHQQERAKRDWLQTGKIQLFNYFHELLVRATVPVEDVADEILTVEIRPTLERVFAADQDMRNAYTYCSDEGLALLLEAHGASGGLLRLRVLELAPHPQGRRRHVRLRVSEELYMTVGRGGTKLGRAYVRDFSEMGLGLRFAPPVPGEVGAQVTCAGAVRAAGETTRLQAKGTIRWINATENETRMGIELQLTPRERNEIQEVLRAYEQITIRMLARRGTPEFLL